MIHTQCPNCEAEFNLKDEFAGKQGKCPKCSGIIDIPTIEEAQPVKGDLVWVKCQCGQEYMLSRGLLGKKGKCKRCENVFDITDDEGPGFFDGVPDIGSKENPFGIFASAMRRNGFFSCSRYGLRHEKKSEEEKYSISDHNGKERLFSVRKRRAIRSMTALLLGIVILLAAVFGTYSAGMRFGKDTLSFSVILVVGSVLSIWISAAIITAIYPLKEIYFYKFEDDGKGAPLFAIKQDPKWGIADKSYTLIGSKGEKIAKFRKNLLSDLFRKKWHLETNGKSIFIKEDSLFRGIIRRYFPLAGGMKTNFIFIDSDNSTEKNKVLGYLRRKFEKPDTNILDLENDPGFGIPRQIGIAMAVLLDMCEK